MSWFESAARGGILAAVLLLAGCFQPLYGPDLLGKDSTSNLRSIEVARIEGRFGHFLRTDLQFALGGGELSQAPQYRLLVSGTPTTRTAIVNSVGTTAQSVSIFVVARYRLIRNADGAEVLNGRVSGSASYERSDQRFASLSASNDAEERAARLISDGIKTRLAMAFASGAIKP